MSSPRATRTTPSAASTVTPTRAPASAATAVSAAVRTTTPAGSGAGQAQAREPLVAAGRGEPGGRADEQQRRDHGSTAASEAVILFEADVAPGRRGVRRGIPSGSGSGDGAAPGGPTTGGARREA